MNLSKATRYGRDRSAVCCVIDPCPAIAHVVRQGGMEGFGWTHLLGYVGEWWIVSLSPVKYDDGMPIGYDLYSPYWLTRSFSTIDGCYTWLKDHGINPYEGWHPARHDQRFWELGNQ